MPVEGALPHRRRGAQILVMRFALLSAFSLALAGLPSATHAQAAPKKPALVVLVTIDQFRGDYLDRFGPQLTGGIARLVRGGAVFTNAHHDHAITETAPGHATLLAGRFPRSTRIMMNSIGVADTAAPLLAGGYGTGASPRRFTGTTLVDWLRGANAQTRVLSVSMKDRAAILPIGRSRSDVYWYSPDGRFVTSKYYGDSLPGWVNQFNDRGMSQSYGGKQWTLLLPESAYPEPDSVPAESDGEGFTFPHPLPADGFDAASMVRTTPFIDDLVVASDDALFGYPEVHIGFVPAMVMTMLVRAVGEKRTFALVALGNRIGAQEAHEHGLVHAVFSRHTFFDDAFALAIDLATRSRTSLSLSKRLLYELDELTFDEGIERGAEVNAEARATEDCRSGVRAFLARQNRT